MFSCYECTSLHYIYFFFRFTRNYLKECHQSSELSEEAIIKYEQSKEDAWQKCMELNDEWNKSLAVEREKREILAFEKQIEEARLLMKETDDFKREKQEEIEKLIKEQKVNYIIKFQLLHCFLFLIT